ncbi:MAG: hypothetical protein V4635_10145 [Bacteroidota bacterium]
MQRLNKISGQQQIRLLINIFVFVSLFIYVLLRALNLSFTYDECLSLRIVNGDKALEATANNHLLNTFLMALCSKVFGDNEISLRLPNVLAFVVYCLSAIGILKEQKNNLFYLFGISLLFFNLYLLDFFSLARGYGLSMGFMMGALYFLLKPSTGTYLSNFIKAMLCSSLALFSNLALLNFYLAVFFLFVFAYLRISRKDKNHSFKQHGRFMLMCLLALVPLWFAVQRVLYLKTGGQLYFGEDSFDSTLSLLLRKSLFLAPYPEWFIVLIDQFIRYIFPLGLSITILMKKFSGPLAKISMVMVLIMISLFLENSLFSATYPPSRTNVYFIPLFGLFIYFFFGQLVQNRSPVTQRVVAIALLLIISLPPTLPLLLTLNLTNTVEWRYDSHTKDAVMAMKSEMERLPAKAEKTILETNWVFEPSAKYYVSLHKLNVVLLNRDSIGLNSDFLYDYETSFKEGGYVELARYPEFDSRIYKKE